MCLLDKMANDCDVEFEQTHGGQERRRDKSNANRVGGGFSKKTAVAASDCTRIRRMIKAVWREEWSEVKNYVTSWRRQG